MFNWQTVKVKDCIEKVIYTSKIPKNKYKPNGKYPIVSQDNELICGYWDNPQDVFITGKPIIVFGDHTQVLKFIDFDFVLGADGVKLLRPKKFLDPKFFYYALKSVNLKKLGYARHFRLLKEVEVNYPESLSEQKRLVALLDDIFEKLEKAKANAEKNLKNAKELFEAFFEELFSQAKDDWDERSFGDKELLQIVDGDRGKNYPKKSDFLEDGYCLFMNTKNVRKDGFHFDQTMFITKQKDEALGKGRLKRGDVVLTTRGTIGNIGLYNSDVPYNVIRINSGMLIFRTNKDLLLPEYLFELLRSGFVKSQIEKRVSGAAQPQLPIKTLVNFSLPLPKSLNQQREIVEKIRLFNLETKMLEKIYKKKVAHFTELKQSILHQAFTGKFS